ncbi:universal stress protein [Flexivirga oryzae]|uniref:Nucleotide-binding universal stress UspA family protein n=1 Tax=Flexivirga oryzae TaxID=1794944 RepID=A0A839N666_9MICO|nr:universal stress protein [Flexivirga oryzae]MBB2891553.1 nucleotide-binding universal stress UspA family protein [Flexivirga oryzae]
MAVVVGYAPEESGTTALEAASVLARSLDEPLVVAVVVAVPHVSDLVPVDGDYVGTLREWGHAVLDQARASLPSDIAATYEVREAPSIPIGLLDLAAEVDASAVVLGSSSKGVLGRISFGSITSRLVHSAPRPVVLAPRGFRSGPQSRIRRVVVAYSGAADGAHLADTANRLAQEAGAELRAVSFVVRPPKRLLETVEQSADDLVADAWVSRTKDHLREQAGGRTDQLGQRLADSLTVGVGLSWSRAIGNVPWAEGDLLVVGSSAAAPATRLFLGSDASKIVRSSPVPVLLVPRSTE